MIAFAEVLHVSYHHTTIGPKPAQGTEPENGVC